MGSPWISPCILLSVFRSFPRYSFKDFSQNTSPYFYRVFCRTTSWDFLMDSTSDLPRDSFKNSLKKSFSYFSGIFPGISRRMCPVFIPVIPCMVLQGLLPKLPQKLLQEFHLELVIGFYRVCSRNSSQNFPFNEIFWTMAG